MSELIRFLNHLNLFKQVTNDNCESIINHQYLKFLITESDELVINDMSINKNDASRSIYAMNLLTPESKIKTIEYSSTINGIAITKSFFCQNQLDDCEKYVDINTLKKQEKLQFYLYKETLQEFIEAEKKDSIHSLRLEKWQEIIKNKIEFIDDNEAIKRFEQWKNHLDNEANKIPIFNESIKSIHGLNDFVFRFLMQSVIYLRFINDFKPKSKFDYNQFDDNETELIIFLNKIKTYIQPIEKSILIGNYEYAIKLKSYVLSTFSDGLNQFKLTGLNLKESPLKEQIESIIHEFNNSVSMEEIAVFNSSKIKSEPNQISHPFDSEIDFQHFKYLDENFMPNTMQKVKYSYIYNHLKDELKLSISDSVFLSFVKKFKGLETLAQRVQASANESQKYDLLGRLSSDYSKRIIDSKINPQ